MADATIQVGRRSILPPDISVQFTTPSHAVQNAIDIVRGRLDTRCGWSVTRRDVQWRLDLPYYIQPLGSRNRYILV